MKKILLGTSALLLAGMVSASANASNIKLSVGGYANWYTGYVGGNSAMKDDASLDDGSKGYETVPIIGDVEIDFKGEAVLQNGLKIGAVIELSGISADKTEDDMPDGIKEDQSYVYIDGAFGRFAIGKMDTISKQFHKASKDVGLLGIQASDIGMLQPGFGVGMMNVSTDIRDWDDDATLAYISPKFYGFTVAASYSNLDTDATHNMEGNDVSYAATVAYNNTFGKVTLDANVSYARFDKAYSVYDEDNDVYTGWQEYAIATGIRVGVAGFTIGGGYKFQNGKGEQADTNTFDVGVAYETGPYGVSLSYINQTENNDYLWKDDEKVQMLLGSFAYNVTEGVDTFVSLAYIHYDDKDSIFGHDKEKAYIIATGMGLTF